MSRGLRFVTGSELSQRVFNSKLRLADAPIWLDKYSHPGLAEPVQLRSRKYRDLDDAVRIFHLLVTNPKIAAVFVFDMSQEKVDEWDQQQLNYYFQGQGVEPYEGALSRLRQSNPSVTIRHAVVWKLPLSEYAKRLDQASQWLPKKLPFTPIVNFEPKKPGHYSYGLQLLQRADHVHPTKLQPMLVEYSFQPTASGETRFPLGGNIPTHDITLYVNGAMYLNNGSFFKLENGFLVWLDAFKLSTRDILHLRGVKVFDDPGRV